MGRPERPLDPEAGPLQRFGLALRQLRQEAGQPSYRELSRITGYSVTALSEAAGGDRLPSLAVTIAYVAACDGDPDDWEKRWRAVTAELIGDPQDAPAAPYLGLAAFELSDASRFFGRSELVAELAERLRANSFLAVFGASGSGKSSVLRAGLLPELGARDATLVTPGEHPVVALANQPIGSVLVVDQFEEVFTLCRDEAERSRFIDTLLDLAESDGTRVVLGVRADFYARCAEHPRLVHALRDRQVLIGPMSEVDLRSVIAEPAAAVGLRVETALVEAVIADADREPGALPLVSHALLETWNRHRGRTLTLAGYRDAGGVEGAIAQTAERVYADFDAEQQELAKGIFLRLTAVGEGTEDTRRRAGHDELLSRGDSASVAAVIDVLARARLITLDQDTATVAHEALIRNWPRLLGWLAEDRESLRLHRQITESAADWLRHDRDEGYLYRGARLAIWELQRLDPLNDNERAFLDACRQAGERERHSRRRRVRLTVIGLSTAVALVSVLAGVAVWQADQSAEERDIAFSRQLAANARTQLGLDPELALLLAREAYAAKPTKEAETALRQATAESRIRAVLHAGQGPAYGVAFSADGTRVATTGDDGTVRVWDAKDMREIRTLAGPKMQVWGPAFSPNGALLAAGRFDGTIALWDLTTSAEPRILRGHKENKAVWNLAFAPDGQRLASVSDDGTIRIWDSAGNAVAVLPDAHKRAMGVAFSPNGKLLASTGGDDFLVKVWDLADPRAPRVFTGHEASVEGIAFGPDSKRVASASTDGTVRVWQLEQPDGQPTVLRGPSGTVEAIAFSPDGHHVAGACDDGTVRVWNVTDDDDHVVMRGHNGPVWAVTFSPDGNRVASASGDGTVRFWDPASPGEAVFFNDDEGSGETTAISADGRRVASGGDDGKIRVWQTSDPANSTVLDGGTSAQLHVDFSADGNRLAGANTDGSVKIWDLTAASEPVTLPTRRGQVWGSAFSADGKQVATGSSDGVLRLWRADGSGEPMVQPGNQTKIRATAFSQDGRLVAGAGHDGTVQVWPTDRIAQPVVLRGHQGGLVWTVTFSPNGRQVASGGGDGTIRIWNADGSGEPIILRGHHGPVWSVAFRADGTGLVSMGDQTLRIWDLQGGGDPIDLHGFTSLVREVRYTADGERILTSHADGTTRLWRPDVCDPIDQVLALGRSRTTRDLTVAERRAYLNGA